MLVARSAVPQGSSRGPVAQSSAQGKGKGPFLRGNLSRGLANKDFVPNISADRAVQLRH